MAEPILQRVRRVLTAKFEDAVDGMERSGSDGVMREAIREIDRVIDEVRADHEAAMTRRLQGARQQKILRDKAGEFTSKASFALRQGRQDLAEAALSRQLDFETQANELDAVQSIAGEEEGRLSEILAALGARKREMEDALGSFVASRAHAALGGDGPARPAGDRVRRIERAEQAFGRALNACQGAGLARADSQAADRVAELDNLHKSALVAERLAALKQECGAA
jgi:phage shock protein A